MSRGRDWIITYTGRAVYPLDLRPEDVCIDDIAHALSLQCRWGGHTREFYSVAEHSVRVALLCPIEHRLWGLLHDAAEAYLIDVPRPLKGTPDLAAYRMAEHNAMRAICEAFDLPLEMPAVVAEADDILLATEARDLLPPSLLEQWTPPTAQPIPFPITPRPWDTAERQFLNMFRELTSRIREPVHAGGAS